MAARILLLHSQRRVQEQDAVLGPSLERTVLRDRDSSVVVKLGVDPDERPRKWWHKVTRDREGKSGGMRWIRVRILPKDHRPNVHKRRGKERGEDKIRVRQHREPRATARGNESVDCC
jgi:hypothetical protein